MKQARREASTRLAEGLGTDLAASHRVAPQMAEKRIQFALNAAAHARDHHCCDARQSQTAITGECARKQAHLIGKRWVEEESGELIQQRLGVDGLSS